MHARFQRQSICSFCIYEPFFLHELASTHHTYAAILLQTGENTVYK